MEHLERSNQQLHEALAAVRAQEEWARKEAAEARARATSLAERLAALEARLDEIAPETAGGRGGAPSRPAGSTADAAKRKAAEADEADCDVNPFLATTDAVFGRRRRDDDKSPAEKAEKEAVAETAEKETTAETASKEAAAEKASKEAAAEKD